VHIDIANNLPEVTINTNNTTNHNLVNIKSHQSIGNIPHFQKSFEIWGNLKLLWNLYSNNLPIVSGVRVTRSLVLCVCFVDRCLSFCPFYFRHWLSILWFRDSDYPFGIFKRFLSKRNCAFYVINIFRVSIYDIIEFIMNGRLFTHL
jgi:hypothetical protein